MGHELAYFCCLEVCETVVELGSYGYMEVMRDSRFFWFPKIRGTILAVPIIRTKVFWGLYWGPLILGKYP